MLRVGLTGSIAVGKSFVSGVLAESGCHVIDADVVARSVVEKGTHGLQLLVEKFGVEILESDGTLGRARMSEIIFADREKRELLNSLLHPLIIQAQDEQLRRWEETDPAGVGIVDAALLIESGGHERFDKIIVVHCRPDIQLTRLMERNNLTRVEAERRIASQLPQQEKLRYADYAIDTSDGFDETRRQVVNVFDRLTVLAESGL